MDQEINDNEVLSDNQSISTTRPSSSASSDMPKTNSPSRSNSFIKRQSSSIDINDLPPSVNQQINDQVPVKVLIFNGNSSRIFKSALEDCVEDCILEFPSEKISIYVPRIGQAIQMPLGSTPNTIRALREQSATARRSARRRGSISQYTSLPQINTTRGSLPNNLVLPSLALAATTAARMRHQLVQQKFSINDNISEEAADQQSNIEQPQIINTAESEVRIEKSPIAREETIFPTIKHDVTSVSLPAFHSCYVPSTKTHKSYRDRQKDYRLSDLVMLGPEYYRNVFNLPRSHSPSVQRKSKEIEKISEIDLIKKDLFHRYLWTQKPQVSCRIRPLSTYTRGATFVN